MAPFCTALCWIQSFQIAGQITRGADTDDDFARNLNAVDLFGDLDLKTTLRRGKDEGNDSGNLTPWKEKKFCH